MARYVKVSTLPQGPYREILLEAQERRHALVGTGLDLRADTIMLIGMADIIHELREKTYTSQRKLA